MGHKRKESEAVKILMTGITSIQTNSRGPRSKRDYMSFPYVLYDMLVKLKHHVDFKPYNPSYDKLNKYDLVICGLAPTSSRVSVYAYNAFLAMQHENVLFYINDWQVKAAFSERIMKDPFGEFVAGCNKLSPSNVERKIIQKKIDWFFSHKHDVLCQMFNWGDHDKVKDGTPIRNVIAIDPTPCMTLPKCTYNGKKAKSWVSATLKDNDKKLSKLNASWPIVEFNKNNYMSEKTLISEEYPKHWGSIVLPYYHRGCGWFRGRFLHTLNAGSIVLANSAEVYPMTPKGTNPFIFDVEEVEVYTTKRLTDLAEAQNGAFYRYVWKAQDTLDRLNDIVKGWKTK